MTTESQQLLADYITNASETAFRELVMRYMDLVFSTALRLVGGDTHRAEDVAQMVFVDLTRLARKLPAETMLGGWLHRHTCFVAAKVMRGERRRQMRERQAVEMNALNSTVTDLAHIAPVLDEAINELGDEDRKAILLRFYEKLDLRSVGDALGSSENAAQKRVSRALERLQFTLTHRGLALSAGALAAALTGQAVTAAPAGLAASVSVMALVSAAAGAGSALSLVKLMTMTKLNVGIAAIVVAGGVTAHFVLQRQSQAKLHTQDEMLQQQNERIVQLAAEAQRLSSLVAGSTPSQNEKNELARLRGEVGALRRELTDARQAQTNGVPPQGQFFVGVNSGEFRAALTNSPTLNFGKALGLAFRLYSADNQGQFPTNLDQVETYIPASQAAPKETRDRFEFVNQDSVQNLTNPANTIVIREKQPWQGPGGLWLKTYVFADGHISTQSTSDGNFDSWEQMHTISALNGGSLNQ